MPYKDPERKRQWERLHRSGRLARRRELRQADAASEAAQPELKLAAAAFYKKDWSWWIVGLLILVLGLFFLWDEESERELAILG